jgi:RNA polymerase sigma factor (sigma-70 family)
VNRYCKVNNSYRRKKLQSHIKRNCKLQHTGKIRILAKTIQINTELLKACVRDDRKAIRDLYEHCFTVFMPVCYRYHNNEEDARSSLNIAFMKILGGLENVDEQLNFPAWAKRIVVNTLIDEYRKKKNYNSKVTAKETERELDQHGAQASNDGEASFAYENLLKLIAQLPEISGKVFNLYVIEGYNHKEIGDLLGFSEGTSKWHLSTARKALREKLEKIENWNSRMVV